MVYFKIKSEKQNNGLWGMPMNIVNLNIGGFVKKFDELKFSAILMGLGERYSDAKLSISAFDSSNNKIFRVDIDKGTGKTDVKIFKISDYDLIGNTLYYMQSEDDKLMFNRIKKLRNLKQNYTNSI